MGKIYYASGQSVTLSVDREKADTPRILSFIDAGSIKLNKTTYFKIGNAVCVIDQDMTIDWANLDTGSEESGIDYFVYVCLPSVGNTPVIKISLNATYPQGYTSNNSRKIGGFHNNPDGDILECSVWDLDFRPACSDPTGMVYDPSTNIWVDIYLPSDNGSGGVQSRYNASIMKTAWHEFCTKGFAGGKRLLHFYEFISAATGSPEQKNINGGSEPPTTGGHQASDLTRIKSAIGIEDATGVLEQAGFDLFYRIDGTDLVACKAWDWYDPGLGKGQTIRQGDYGIAIPAFGGFYTQDTKCGSRYLDLSTFLWGSSSTLTARFCCEHYSR